MFSGVSFHVFSSTCCYDDEDEDDDNSEGEAEEDDDVDLGGLPF